MQIPKSQRVPRYYVNSSIEAQNTQNKRRDGQTHTLEAKIPNSWYAALHPSIRSMHRHVHEITQRYRRWLCNSAYTIHMGTQAHTQIHTIPGMYPIVTVDSISSSQINLEEVTFTAGVPNTYLRQVLRSSSFQFSVSSWLSVTCLSYTLYAIRHTQPGQKEVRYVVIMQYSLTLKFQILRVDASLI